MLCICSFVSALHQSKLSTSPTNNNFFKTVTSIFLIMLITVYLIWISPISKRPLVSPRAIYGPSHDGMTTL
jgi:hypothetical protein